MYKHVMLFVPWKSLKSKNNGSDESSESFFIYMGVTWLPGRTKLFKTGQIKEVKNLNLTNLIQE